MHLSETDHTGTDSPDVELFLAARAENVAVARQVVGGVGDALGLSAEAVADVRLAVSEACTNVIVHAYENPADESFSVALHVDRPLLHIAVRDRGRGFNSREAGPSNGLGLGLQLVEAVGESVALTELPGHNEIKMTFVVPDGRPVR